MKRPLRSRNGYAILVIVLFLVLFLAFLGVAYRQTATALRIETVRSQQALRDQGSIPAAARGVALLETGFPPTSPYACGVTINAPGGPLSYAVTFTQEGTNAWAVSVAPATATEDLPLMPSTFGP
jgi:hypothetical protein